MRTEINFDKTEVDLGEQTLTASLGWHKDPRFGIELGLGALLGGSLTEGGIETDLDVGFLASLSGSWLALPETESRPFILVTADASVATTEAGPNRFTAVDLRAGAALGKTFFTRFTPYLAARVFGGPVYWTIDGAGVIGNDAHHYAVGAGANLRLPAGFDVFVEGSPLGERSLNFGVGASF